MGDETQCVPRKRITALKEVPLVGRAPRPSRSHAKTPKGESVLRGPHAPPCRLPLPLAARIGGIHHRQTHSHGKRCCGRTASAQEPPLMGRHALRRPS